MIIASKYGNLDIVKLLVKNGADVNARTTKGATALTYGQSKSLFFNNNYRLIKIFIILNSSEFQSSRYC